MAPASVLMARFMGAAAYGGRLTEDTGERRSISEGEVGSAIPLLIPRMEDGFDRNGTRLMLSRSTDPDTSARFLAPEAPSAVESNGNCATLRSYMVEIGTLLDDEGRTFRPFCE
ncbi:hypothetical protein EV182_006083 [Spiromyces aspiralis]|uniref:Uncharacterized protein n=1 Tax=Spiromyces aspiralis TaxID=68401 RepID=A0ACC1HM13_9FUNG|nr:hypothetical protein EV182_006083 [Spiromyces aspiralis]